jgi:hypothetical protein
MSDITHKLFPGHAPAPVPLSESIKISSELVRPTQYFTITSKTQELSEIYKKLQSSIPLSHMHDRDAM